MRNFTDAKVKESEWIALFSAATLSGYVCQQIGKKRFRAL